MGRTIDALKALGAKCNTSHATPDGNSIAEVLANIADDFDITGAAGADGEDGTDGTDGASVTAITLYTTEGAITGGVATLSNGQTVNITVTTAPAEQG